MLDRVHLVKHGFLQDTVGLHYGYRTFLDYWIRILDSDTGFGYWIRILDSDIGYGSLDLLHKETPHEVVKK